jgi:hypothetical protein
MTGKLMEYFNKQPRIGVISTSSKEGKVDSAGQRTRFDVN